MDLKKTAFIEAYIKSFGNITKSCKAAEVSRQCYYRWIKEDNEFKAEVDAIEPNEVFVDFAENSLLKKIQEGDTTAIIFALKTRGKKRGYVERQEIEAKVEETKLPSWFSQNHITTIRTAERES